MNILLCNKLNAIILKSYLNQSQALPDNQRIGWLDTKQ
jgi:hypothetical protein